MSVQAPSSFDADVGAAAYRTADALLATHGRSFHWARRLLGARHAARATRLYGFCRTIDDIADETPCATDARLRLEAIALDVQHGHRNDPRVADMLDLLDECRIDRAIVIELIAGVRGDLLPVRIADERALLRYCYRVAGTVGLMMCASLDVDEPAARPHAIDLGIAMQLTNICRDVREDALVGRRYLPATLVGDIDPESLLAPLASVRAVTSQAVSQLLALADRYYASGEAGLHYLPRGARGGMLVAGRVYRGIGDVVMRQRCDMHAPRAVVGGAAKLAISARALLHLAGGGLTRSRGVAHDPGLHVALDGLAGSHAAVGA